MRRLAIAALAIGLLSGCTPSRPVVPVLRGNFAYARGDYQAALVHYLSSTSGTTDPWVLFNTANVYYALGELDAALATWDEARLATVDSASSSLLVHAASFNRGVLLYERGQFGLAYDEFRYALELVPGSLSAKINLELALDRSRAADPSPGPGATEEPGDATDPDDTSTLRILEYVRRKEANQWTPNRDDIITDTSRDW